MTDFAELASLESVMDADVVARQVVQARKKLKKPAPPAASLEAAITRISIKDTIEGASTLTIDVADLDWVLIDSGFFDADADGRLDRIDLNYPEGSRQWWRLTQTELNGSAGLGTVTMTFMERQAVLLMSKTAKDIDKQYRVTSRAKTTRAQFISHLVRSVKAFGGIHFISKQIDAEQPIGSRKERSDEAKQQKEQLEDDKRANKDPGISKKQLEDGDLTVKGAAINESQLALIELSLSIANELNAGNKATQALVVGCIQESGYDQSARNASSGATGVLQALSDPSIKDKPEEQIKSFLEGGRGYQGGGAIKLARDNGSMSPGEIAVRVLVPSTDYKGFAVHYNKWLDEADALIQAFGGASPGSTTNSYRSQYSFQVGGQDNPNETFWDACNRLAAEVQWAFFCDRDRIFYDSEFTLIRQKAAAVWHREDPEILRFSMNWDMRKIATECEVDVVCDAFDFRAGEVVILRGMGPASTGSTARPRQPGRWLIAEIDRDRDQPFSTFRLKQPIAPKNEPLDNPLVQRQEDPTFGGENLEKPDGTYRGSPVPGQKPHAATHETSGLPGYPAYDYMEPAGTPCVAPEDGRITRLSGRDPKLGGPPGGPLGYSIYMTGSSGNQYFLTHLDNVLVKAGQRVEEGEQIAEVAHGPASWSSPHVHMGVKRG